MGYRTPKIDRLAAEGMTFTDYYAEQSCTAGWSSFITDQNVFRTGLSKVGMPAAPVGLHKEDPNIAEMLKPLGYATGQFDKNHLGDLNEYLPTVHGFVEFFGNLFLPNSGCPGPWPFGTIRSFVSARPSCSICVPTLTKELRKIRRNSHNEIHFRRIDGLKVTNWVK
jgi:arylsulfatase A-like enzyme